jgi:hypothetical protein
MVENGIGVRAVVVAKKKKKHKTYVQYYKTTSDK